MTHADVLLIDQMREYGECQTIRILISRSIIDDIVGITKRSDIFLGNEV